MLENYNECYHCGPVHPELCRLVPALKQPGGADLDWEHVAAFHLRPHGPGRTTIRCQFLFHPDEIARPGFNPSDAVDFWDLVNRQDWSICESVQRGMSSRMFPDRLLRADGKREPGHPAIRG